MYELLKTRDSKDTKLHIYIYNNSLGAKFSNADIKTGHKYTQILAKVTLV